MQVVFWVGKVTCPENIGILKTHLLHSFRSVIIDTNHHSTGSIRDQFSRYFVSRQKRLVLELAAIDFDQKDVSVVPGFLASDLLQYDAYFDHEIGHFVEKKTRQPITFDFNKPFTRGLGGSSVKIALAQ
jgi:hypothetical protein